MRKLWLAPLTSVLKSEDQKKKSNSMSFADSSSITLGQAISLSTPESGKSGLYQDLCHDLWYPIRGRLSGDVKYLIQEAKPGTDIQQAINDGLANHPKCLPSRGDFGILPFVTYVFFAQLRLHSAYHTES